MIGTRRLIPLLRREGLVPGSGASTVCHARPLRRADALNFVPKRGMKPRRVRKIGRPNTKGMCGMAWMIWIGAALTLVGVAGLVYCVIIALRAKKAQLPDDQMRAVLQRAVVLNMAALAVSGIGLMCVVFAVMLG